MNDNNSIVSITDNIDDITAIIISTGDQNSPLSHVAFVSVIL